MGARAITEWHQSDSGFPVLLQRNPWLSPSTFLPALADFVHAAREAGQTPEAGLFRSWSADHAPHILGEDEAGDRTTFLAPGSDIQFHYLVQLKTGLGACRDTLVVTVRERDMALSRTPNRWAVAHQISNDDELYDVAADLLTEQAKRIRRLSAAGRGGPMPPPETIEEQARRIRHRIGRRDQRA